MILTDIEQLTDAIESVIKRNSVGLEQTTLDQRQIAEATVRFLADLVASQPDQHNFGRPE